MVILCTRICKVQVCRLRIFEHTQTNEAPWVISVVFCLLPTMCTLVGWGPVEGNGDAIGDMCEVQMCSLGICENKGRYDANG